MILMNVIGIKVMGGASDDAEVPVWASGQFWNFVDHMLDDLRKECRKNSSDTERTVHDSIRRVVSRLSCHSRVLHLADLLDSRQYTRSIFTERYT